MPNKLISQIPKNSRQSTLRNNLNCQNNQEKSIGDNTNARNQTVNVMNNEQTLNKTLIKQATSPLPQTINANFQKLQYQQFINEVVKPGPVPTQTINQSIKLSKTPHHH